MGILIGSGIVLVCFTAGWLIIRRPLREVVEEVHFEQARVLFRQQREWLEARFVTVIGQLDLAAGKRWESADWDDEVLWARDRSTRRLQALVGVHFDGPYNPLHQPGHSTAVFEFHHGRWRVEGRRLDLTRPEQAVGRDQPFEAVADTSRARRLIP